MDKPVETVAARREQYLIARRALPAPGGGEPVDFNAVRAALERDPEIRIKRTLTSTVPGALAGGVPFPQAIIVAEMPRERAERLSLIPRQVSRVPTVVIEPDYPLMLEGAAVHCIRDPGLVGPRPGGPSVTLAVAGKDQQPVEGAAVYLFGDTWLAQGVTDARGQVQLTLFDESVEAVRGLLVQPRAGYWSFWTAEPALDPARPNRVSLVPLDQTFPGFPGREPVGWGARAMRVDQLPATYRGQGVRVALVDSGIAVGHPDLQGVVKGGYDAAGQSAQGWDRDEHGHGSHLAGIIAGAADGKGIRGLAPDAELYAIKVLPGGRVSHLIDALNRCIELQVHLVCLAVGSEGYSELLEEKLREMKDLGIACIAAAGSAGGRVQHPAASPHVLTVGAVGRHGEFPAESYHAAQAADGPDGAEYFAPRFSAFGPEVEVSGPGVAVLSCVPPNDYAVRDGTSVAAAHVTGLAALVLAHHPEFQGALRVRDAVDRLFQILRQSARPLDLGDPNRTGAGLPDAVTALLQRPGAQPAQPDELRRRLLGILEAGQSGMADRGALVEQILAAFQQAGLPPTPLAAPARGLDPRLAFKQLRVAVHQAGLVPADGPRRAALTTRRARRAPPLGGGAERVSGEAAAMPGDGWPMRELTEVMRQAGLL